MLRFTFVPKSDASFSTFSLYQLVWFGAKAKQESLRTTREAMGTK